MTPKRAMLPLGVEAMAGEGPTPARAQLVHEPRTNREIVTVHPEGFIVHRIEVLNEGSWELLIERNYHDPGDVEKLARLLLNAATKARRAL